MIYGSDFAVCRIGSIHLRWTSRFVFGPPELASRTQSSVSALPSYQEVWSELNQMGANRKPGATSELPIMCPAWRLGQNKSVVAEESTLCRSADRKAAGTPRSDDGGPLRKSR